MSSWNNWTNIPIYPQSIIVFNSLMYVLSGNTISTLNLDGTINKINWVTISDPNPYRMINDINGNLYITSTSSGNITLVTNSKTVSTWISGLPLYYLPDQSGLVYNNGGQLDMAIDNTNTYMYVANYDGSIMKINMANATIDKSVWINTGISGSPVAGGNCLTGMCIDNNYLYISSNQYIGSTNPYGQQIIRIKLNNPTIIPWSGSYAFMPGIYIHGAFLYTASNGFMAQISLTNATSMSINPQVINPVISITGYGNILYVACGYRNPRTGLYNISSYEMSGACFNKDTKILTDKGYVPIQNLRKNDMIKTIENGFVPIYEIGYREIYNSGDKERKKESLFKCSKENYPELFEDLIITGCHSILVDDFKDNEREETIKILGKIYVTGDTNVKYRLPACVDNRSEVYEKEGLFTIYHFALENDNMFYNYGVYANGLLVETCSKRYITELAGMTLI